MEKGYSETMQNGTEVVVKFDTLDEAAAAYRAANDEYNRACAHINDLQEQLLAATAVLADHRTRTSRVRNAMYDIILPDNPEYQ